MQTNPAFTPSALLLASLLAAGGAGAAEICDLTLAGCPGLLNGTRIPVPMNVVAVSPGIPYCDEKVTVKTSGAPPISIMFIIDQSGSMNATDSAAARYKVPASLLDHIYASAPDAEVGLVIFSSILEFDHRDNPFFKPAFPGDLRRMNDSYVPLTSLKQTFPGGRTGLDTLKAFLEVEPVPYPGGMGSVLRPRHATRQRSGGGTDITLGFKAAKAAMRDSRAEKQHQYFIFLSDGEPSGQDAEAMEFKYGIETPTTFTVYFTGKDPIGVPGLPGGDVPDVIAEMTDNIKANGFSASNPKSAYWGIDLPADQLKALLQEKVLGQILVVSASPKSAVLVSGSGRFETGITDAANFLFPKRIPLAGASTPFELASLYGYQDGTGAAPSQKDTLVKTSFSVDRVAGAALQPGMSLSCREQATLSLWHGGAALAAVEARQRRLEIRLGFAPGETCAGCPVEVRPSGGADRESIPMRASASGFSGSFGRSLGLAAAPGDANLQHAATDSIVLIWRNPELPLDTVRRAYPFLPAQPTTLAISPLNPIPKSEGRARPSGMHWLLAGAADLAVAAAPGKACCLTSPWPVAAADSQRYAGIRVAATRGFKASVKVFSNLGHFVDEVAFSVPEREFAKLPPIGKDGERGLAIFWRGLASTGAMAGTGAYILRTRIALLPDPAEPPMERTDTRVVGLLR